MEPLVMRSPSRRCVVLFARAPRAEARRKALPAAEPLFHAVAQRVRQAVARVEDVDLLCCGPDSAGPRDERDIPQRGSDFAARLANAFGDARALGYDEVVVIPGDVPGLDERLLARAFELLALSPVVLGPSPDGGVYLIGCRGPADRLLQGVRWRTSHVTRDLLARAPGAARLDRRADVDGARDLSQVRRDTRVPLELRALVASAPLPARALAFEVRAIRNRDAAPPERPRGPPVH
jgi:2-phospho-L-lactate guanylyltransferase (CobY/MobA/RfbA family)